MLPQALAIQRTLDGLIHPTRDGDSEVVQVHGALPRSVAMGITSPLVLDSFVHQNPRVG